MNGAALLPEFEHEMANTRKTLERVPDDHLDFKPHEKSYDLLQLARHVGDIPSWTRMALTTTELDLAEHSAGEQPKNRAEILAAFESGVEAGRVALGDATEEDLAVNWTLRAGEEVMLTMPRAAVYRSFVLNHLIHHRAQLTVYFRLLGIPVPALYGPSADEAS